MTHEILTTWQNQNIDVVIAPGFAFPAPPVKHPARLVPAVSYTAAYNIVDFPAGTVPVTRVIPEDEVKHSALKLEKSTISKVQKHIFLQFQKWQKINFLNHKKV